MGVFIRGANYKVWGAFIILPSSFLTNDAATCPKWLLELASVSDPVPMAFVRATGVAVLESAVQSFEAGLALPHLVGEADEIARLANEAGLSLEGCIIHDTSGEQDAIQKSIALAQDGVVQGFVKGQLHTDVFMGGLVARDAGMRTDQRMVHVFAMFPPDGGTPLMISDGAVNVAPNVDTRVAAALNVAHLCRALEIERPKIAVLSATESQIASVPSSLEAAEVAKACASVDDGADYEGPLSLDLAIAPLAVEQKGMSGSAVAGAANGLIMPDIVSGNVLFKSLVWFGGGAAAGLVMGARLPIILTSRSDPAPARLASIALGAIIQNAKLVQNAKK